MERYQSLGLVAGEKLKRLIKDSKYRTQEEFAFEFGVAVKTVSRWINYGIDSISTIEELAEFFGVGVLDILPA